MKILVATGIYPPDIGGPATYSKLLFDELPKKGVEVEVLSFGEVRHLPKIIRHFVYLLKLLKKGKNIDLIFAQDTVSVGLPALFAAKILRKKFFVRVPGDYAWEQSVQRFGVKETIDDFQNKKYGWKVELLKKIQKITVDGADKVIAPSLYFQRLVSGWVKDKSKVYCIYNGIDLSIANKFPDIQYKPKTIISAGRMVPWKGFNILIEIMKDLPDWQLSIVGDGPQKEELLKFTKENNLENRVIFLGQIKREDLMKKLKESELFILNTHFESFAFQIVEAMAMGTPVITTNIGNLGEIIENGKEGILVTPDDKKAIMEAMENISLNRNQILEEAKIKSRRFSIENTLDELLKLLML
jgi:glycosyltransferase involved in cell wall biosynthesis